MVVAVVDVDDGKEEEIPLVAIPFDVEFVNDCGGCVTATVVDSGSAAAAADGPVVNDL